ncbi:hypothetical protein ACIPEN_12500 [Herbaspirillum chlorophenolicum]|uniref:Uncharacterized protein n=1 Tax=Herbaspirillum chlorophenolicum TaxID=211589 RepID=A0ABW8F052_9BURK
MRVPPETAASVTKRTAAALGELAFSGGNQPIMAFDAGQITGSFFRRHCRILAMMENGQQPKEKR